MTTLQFSVDGHVRWISRSINGSYCSDRNEVFSEGIVLSDTMDGKRHNLKSTKHPGCTLCTDDKTVNRWTQI